MHEWSVLWVFAHNVCALYVCLVPVEARGYWNPRTWVTDACEPPWRCLDLPPDPCRSRRAGAPNCRIISPACLKYNALKCLKYFESISGITSLHSWEWCLMPGIRCGCKNRVPSTVLQISQTASFWLCGVVNCYLPNKNNGWSDRIPAFYIMSNIPWLFLTWDFMWQSLASSWLWSHGCPWTLLLL